MEQEAVGVAGIAQHCGWFVLEDVERNPGVVLELRGEVGGHAAGAELALDAIAALKSRCQVFRRRTHDSSSVDEVSFGNRRCVPGPAGHWC